MIFSKAPNAMTTDTVRELAQDYYPILIYEKNYPVVTAFGQYEKVGFNPYRRIEIPLLVRTQQCPLHIPHSTELTASPEDGSMKSAQ